MTAEQILRLPEWLGAGIFTAAAAALAYVLEGFLEWVQKLLATRRARRASLVDLHALLRATGASFEIQLGHAKALSRSISARDKSKESIGYDEVLALGYPELTNDERETHGIIRGMTEHVMYPLNMQLLQWVHDDKYFKSCRGNGLHGKLAKLLGDLEVHLLMWKAKYEIWIPNQPQNALVFLADEKKHGIGFPYWN